MRAVYAEKGLAFDSAAYNGLAQLLKILRHCTYWVITPYSLIDSVPLALTPDFTCIKVPYIRGQHLPTWSTSPKRRKTHKSSDRELYKSKRSAIYSHSDPIGYQAMKPRPNASSRAATLPNLPTELHLAIMDHLQPLDLLALSLTSRHFQKTSKPQAPTIKSLISSKPSREEKKAFLLHLEHTWYKGRKHYACYHCFKILPAARFADTQISKGRRKGQQYGDGRCCTECGIRGGRYRPGWGITVDKVEYWVCKKCKRAKRPPFCGECNLCLDCYGGSIRRHVKRFGEGHCVFRKKRTVQLRKALHKGRLRVRSGLSEFVVGRFITFDLFWT